MKLKKNTYLIIFSFLTFVYLVLSYVEWTKQNKKQVFTSKLLGEPSENHDEVHELKLELAELKKEIDKLNATSRIGDMDLDGNAEKFAQSMNNSTNIRVMCWIMTYARNLYKATAARDTWGQRCNQLLIISDETDETIPTLGMGSGPGREHLTAKTMQTFDFIYKNHFDDADWFLKADDDTYVVVKNLKHFLSAFAPSTPVYFGHPLNAGVVQVKQGFPSGGAAYVLSKEALRRFGERKKDLCAADFGGEDVEMGKCMEHLGVSLGNTTDEHGRTLFHLFNPTVHLTRSYPPWYKNRFGKYEQMTGDISDRPISFHYIGDRQMYELDFFFNDIRSSIS